MFPIVHGMFKVPEASPPFQTAGRWDRWDASTYDGMYTDSSRTTPQTIDAQQTVHWVGLDNQAILRSNSSEGYFSPMRGVFLDNGLEQTSSYHTFGSWYELPSGGNAFDAARIDEGCCLCAKVKLGDIAVGSIPSNLSYEGGVIFNAAWGGSQDPVISWTYGLYGGTGTDGSTLDNKLVFNASTNQGIDTRIAVPEAYFLYDSDVILNHYFDGTSFICTINGNTVFTTTDDSFLSGSGYGASDIGNDPNVQTDIVGSSRTSYYGPLASGSDTDFGITTNYEPFPEALDSYVVGIKKLFMGWGDVHSPEQIQNIVSWVSS